MEGATSKSKPLRRTRSEPNLHAKFHCSVCGDICTETLWLTRKWRVCSPRCYQVGDGVISGLEFK